MCPVLARGLHARGECGNGFCKGCILTHLLWGDLAIFVEVQVFK